jgi:hypothetical protein
METKRTNNRKRYRDLYFGSRTGLVEVACSHAHREARCSPVQPELTKTLPTEHLSGTTSSCPIIARELLDRSSQEQTQIVQAEDLREEHLRVRRDALDQLAECG